VANIRVRLCERRGPNTFDDPQRLPTFYMNDWSELALRVSARRLALDLLHRQGVRISASPKGTRVYFETLAQIPASIRLLRENGLAADLSDGVARVYQG
jgi:hypothetical protein